MFSRLRVNLEYKLLALICAVALHFYVVSQTHPTRSRTLALSLDTKNIPADMLLDSSSTIPVNVTVEGSSDDIDRVSRDNISAYVDLKGAHAGTNSNLSVQIDRGHAGPVVVTDVEPARAAIVLSTKSQRSLLITPTYPGTPPVGYSYRPPVIFPERVSISGSREAVDSVAQLIVSPTSSAMTNAVDGSFPVVAFDAAGHAVPDITVTPPSVHVSIGTNKVPATKAVLVSPTIIGETAYPYKVVAIQTSPESVKLSGLPSILSTVSTVGTEAIDVTGASTTFVKKVKIMSPSGTTLDVPTIVHVTVIIAPMAVTAGGASTSKVPVVSSDPLPPNH